MCQAMKPIQTLKTATEAFERDYITSALAQHHGDKFATALALDIGLVTLYRKLNLSTAKPKNRKTK